jgi:ketosteroid isomerase-like protein
MNTSRRMLSLGVLGAMLALGACAQRPQAATVDTTADEAAIRKVLDGISSAFNAGDFDGMFAMYSDDVVVLPPGAPDIVGKEAWRAGIDALPTNVAMKMRFDTAELVVSGDIAYERGTYTLDLSDKVTATAVQSITARHIHMFKRQADGSWKGWRLMENSTDPAPSAPPAGQ